jgi:hypothetical protein
MSSRPISIPSAVLLSALLFAAATHPCYGQSAGTRNLKVVGQLPAVQALDVEFDQDDTRPFLYVADSDGSVRVLTTQQVPEVVQAWSVVDGALGRVVDVEHFRIGPRQYLAAGVAKADGSGSIVFAEVTVVRKDAPIREIARLETVGIVDLFAYKHSSGRALLVVADGGPLKLFDAAALLAGASPPMSTIPTPPQLERSTSGFDYVYAGFHPDSETDRLYGAGAGGYHVFDITDPESPSPLATINPATIRRGGAAVSTPDGRYVVSSAGYRGSPVRIFDLQPVFDGELPMVRTSESAWAANWKNMCTDFQVRWPLVFAAGMDDGLQVFNMRDPAAPYTVAWYHTWQPVAATSSALDRKPEGAWSIDVRNADGLIAVGDLNTGLWLFNLEGFQGWSGHGYGLGNVSSAQDWAAGPDRFGSR